MSLTHLKLLTLFTTDIIKMPFHASQYLYHHSMSERADTPRRTKWVRCFTVVDKSISLCRNDGPAHTALHAWLNEPIRDKSSLFLHAFLPHHDAKEVRNQRSLSWGKRISIASEIIFFMRDLRLLAPMKPDSETQLRTTCLGVPRVASATPPASRVFVSHTPPEAGD